MLWASCALHLVAGFFGIWLLVYRNRGLNRKIVTDLFIIVGTGIKPKPMDCIIFFCTIACFVKVPANILIIIDVLPNSFWLRIAVEQLYWIVVAVAFSSYFVGLLYAMPVTTREGIFAVYQPETLFESRSLPAIHVLTPTTSQKNALLAMGVIYPSLFAAGFGIASGVLRDRGHEHASRILGLCQYGNWALILYVMALMFFYYGLKYTFILRANIIIAEAALNAPRAAFGIGNLKSRSPARFLFVQLQITGFGGCAVTVLAGSLCLLWVLFQQQILDMKREEWPHTIAFFWTCAMAVAFFVVMALITAQSVRNRRRGLHEPSSTMPRSCGAEDPSSGSGGANAAADDERSGGTVNGSGGASSLKKQGSLNQHQYSLQSYHSSSKGSKQVMSRFDPEACLTHNSSGDVSTLHSVVMFERRVSNDNDDFEAVGGTESDRDSYKTPSLTPPPRPLNTISTGSRGNGALSMSSSSAAANVAVANADSTHSQIRESVFGGRTPREDNSRHYNSSSSILLPQSPTTVGGFNMPSFPLSLRSSAAGSRNSAIPRPSTSSVTSATNGNTPSYHTTSISIITANSSSRLSGNFSSGSPSVTTAATLSKSPVANPTQIILKWSPGAQQHHMQPLSLVPSSPPPMYNPQCQYSQQQVSQQVSQQVPQLGGAARKQFDASVYHSTPRMTTATTGAAAAAATVALGPLPASPTIGSGAGGATSMSISAPIALPASRGGGGGYRSQSIELE
ncbi:hypothetical protein EDD11_006582 [Mortierella claussenii]|nr:hypothetical protein EDD11_006582 [Mortierella claussenii]